MGNRRAAPVEHTAPASATVADLPTRTPTLARQQTNSKKRQRQQPNASASANHLPTRTPTHQQTNKKRQRQQPTALANTNGIQRPPQRQRKRRGSGSRKPEVIVLSDESEPESEPAAASSRPAEPTSSRNSSMSQFESRDYFTVLGLSRSATDADIRKAYRKLAVQWHPDKNRENPKAEEYFKRIAEAYEVLSDPEKRRQYERSGTQGGGGEDDTFSGFAFHSGGFSSRHARDIFEAFFGGGHDPFDTPFFREAGRDPFDTPFFRGAGVSGRSGRRQPAMDPFDDFDDAFGFGFGFPSMGRGGSPFRHSSRGMNGSVMAGNMRSFSSQTVSSSTSTDRHGRVVTTTTTTTMTPDGRAETVTETFRDGALLSSSSSNSRLAGAGRMQLDHRGARQLS